MSAEGEPRQPHGRSRLRPFALDIDRMRAGLGGVETSLYVVVGVLLIAAGALILFDTVKTGIDGLGRALPAADVGLRVLDRVLLLLIVAELLYTLQLVIARGEIAAEPFLFIGLIAVIRRVLVITAETEKLPLGGRELTNFLLELAILAGLVLAIGLAVYLLRRGAAAERAAMAHSQPPPEPSGPSM